MVDPDDVKRWCGEFELTEPQVLWAICYADHRNAMRAGREAGYSENSLRTISWHNSRHPRIKALVALIDKERTIHVPVSRRDILAHSLEIYRRAMAEGQLEIAQRANEQMAKHADVRAFIQQADPETANKMPADLEAIIAKLSPDDIEAIADIAEKLHTGDTKAH